ncbi:hypothetical protein DICPUDRAFT_31218 [Dictyostelium purpureum]|uniref:Uncharacterized protein n=1 Tax=Dictyostelium purpureum TaxID=5786 RepID=F0ZGS5_DICPU|nr:uncharacterized protein DICPUDRAFT_31218 [Dictyostelium purpureum]EGC36821.1 hypothetical protein DICPUDRAFT_31218 [Dictyostelium purpureum]|eukprot:XP_003286619.1 hypothetical protein DICPUDRAFT_31218 [Dictyostelium purpureum]
MATNNTTIGIIGTTGRDKSRPLNKKHFEFMADVLEQYLENLFNEHKEIERDNVTLYSGGAAWADHTAVDFFLKNSEKCKLVVYLPCPIVEKQLDDGTKVYKFEDNGTKGVSNPGRTTNGYHENFSKQIGRDTILDIVKAKELGAIIDNSVLGFKNRNTCISKADFLVAFTGAPGNAPLGGGTLDTWKKSNSKYKSHITIPESFTKIN